MKKTVIVLIAAATSIPFIGIKATKETFTLEWHKITLQTYPSISLLLAPLETIYIEAFMPVKELDVKMAGIQKFKQLKKTFVYAKDLLNSNLTPEEKEQKIIAAQLLHNEWQEQLVELKVRLQKGFPSLKYVIIAKNDQQEIIGFTLLAKPPIKNYLDDLNILETFKGSEKYEALTSTKNDQIYVDILAVSPKNRKKGVGKALLFEVFKKYTHIKKIYLFTWEKNKNAREFYEHLGFKHMLKEDENILYVY